MTPSGAETALRLVLDHYGRLFASLRRAGTPIPINDIWIAATAMDCGGHLLTFDGDFDKLPFIDRTVLPVPDTGSR